MKLWYVLFITVLIFFAETIQAETCHHGSLNLTSIQREPENYIQINGTAPIYWKQFLTTEKVTFPSPIKPTAQMTIPGHWTGIETAQGKLPATGWATIVIRVTPPQEPTELALKLPPIRTAYSLYADSTLLTSVGIPGTSASQAVPAYQPQAIKLPVYTKPYNLIFHISNFSNNKGGPWQPIYVGLADKIFRLYDLSFFYDTFFVGLLAVLALVHMTSFTFYRNFLPQELILSLCCFTISTLVLAGFRGEQLFTFLLPGLPAEFYVRIEYVALFTSCLFYYHYIHFLFRGISSEYVRRYVLYSCVLFIAIAVLAPVRFSSNIIPLCQLNIFIIMCYLLVLAYRARHQFGSASILNLISILVIFLAAIHDIRSSHGLTSIVSLTPLANFLVVLLQTVLLTGSQAKVFRDHATMEKSLTQINQTVLRFVPPQIFSILNVAPNKIRPGLKKDILCTVMVADIRDFTSLSERMSPEMNYAFINRFLEGITPVITANNGFINNFIGDAFIAVFPNSSTDAVTAAQEIQKMIFSGEQFSSFMLKEPLKLGIGIDFGAVTLGIQGSEQRMENTLLGPTVRNASRLEERTKATGASILVTNRVIAEVPKSLTEGRELGYDSEEFENVQLVELYVAADIVGVKRKRRTSQTVQESVQLMKNRKFEEAYTLLNELTPETVRYDQGVTYLKERCSEMILQA